MLMTNVRRILVERIPERSRSFPKLNQRLADRDRAADHRKQRELQRRGLCVEALLKQLCLLRGLLQLAELREL